MTAPARIPPAAPASGLSSFVDSLLSFNPFAVNRVDRLASPGADVSGIHRGPYEKIISLARDACAHNRGIGVMLWGEAGSGKSHLLSRLAQWSGQKRNASFVYLHNLLPNPEQLPRYVLKYVVSFLTGGLVGLPRETTLFRLINAAVREALRNEGKTSATWANMEAAYDQLVSRLWDQDPTRAVLLDHDVFRVLFLFYRSAHSSRGKTDPGLAALAVRWLSGEPLDVDEARRLGLRIGRNGEDGVALADDQQIKQVLFALTQLALCRRQPFLLCFDQVDNLGRDRMAALAPFLHDLLDNCGNLLVVLCGVKNTLLEYHQGRAIPAAAWDRLAQYRIDLPPISKKEGRQILEARLEGFIDDSVHSAELKRQLGEDSLFPLGLRWYEGRSARVVEIQPRRVIDWGRERWEEQQARLAAEPFAEWLTTWRESNDVRPPEERDKAVDKKVNEKIAELTARRMQEPHTLPPSAENLSGLVATLLEQCKEQPAKYAVTGLYRPAPPRRNQRPPYDFEVRRLDQDGRQADTGVLFIATDSATSTTGYLRRFLHATAGGHPPRLLLVTEERQPLRLGSAGQGYLKELTERASPQFSQRVLTFEQYASLDALQAVIGLARSGDLEVKSGPEESPAVTEAEVIASHHRCGRYLAHPLLRELLVVAAAAVSPPSEAQGEKEPRPRKEPPPSIAETIDERDLREVIMARLSLTIGSSSHEMAAYFAEYRGRKGQQILPPDVCRAAVEKAANQLHAEGKLQATPGPDGLYLLLK